MALKTEGLKIGQRAAKAILDLRAADGSDTPLQDFSYPQGTNPGEWRFTPDFPIPTPAFALAPGWGTSRRLSSATAPSSVRILPMPVTSKKYAADFNEIKSLGGDDVHDTERAHGGAD